MVHILMEQTGEMKGGTLSGHAARLVNMEGGKGKHHLVQTDTG